MRVAVCTNVYNERFNLPLWYRHYANAFGARSLFVLDHGSDYDVARECPDASIIRLPRTPFDDAKRSIAVSDFASSLFGYFDAVIYTDCDELLVADPRRYDSLMSFAINHPHDVATAIGLDVLHDTSTEPNLDLVRSIAQQRAFARLNRHLCKTLFTRKPLRWGGGFHSSSAPPQIEGLFLFHLRWADLDASLARLATTREMQWSESDFGRHQRFSDDDHKIVLTHYNSAAICDTFFATVDAEALNQINGSRFNFWSRRYVLTAQPVTANRLRIDALFRHSF